MSLRPGRMSSLDDQLAKEEIEEAKANLQRLADQEKANKHKKESKVGAVKSAKKNK